MTRKFLSTISAIFALFALSSCSETVSYSELLDDEKESTNWFLSNQKIINTVPADSIFEYGEDAPYYRMDDEGFVYMQVINPGTKDNKAKF
ncbi:MAG: DUF4827 family protein, partial [Muribaculaceae bacterium]|nr:DUF4827 family protein [Muribaculaceae bacterium]